MRRIFVFTVLAFTLIVLTPGTICMAQGIPQGSYQQTCNNVAVNGNVLTANCQDSHSNWINAQLPDVQRCTGDITNDNGALRCATSGYGTPAGYQTGNGPNGSYMQSCPDIPVGGDDLPARSPTSEGSRHDTQLAYHNKGRRHNLNRNRH